MSTNIHNQLLEAELDLIEVQAYRELQSTPFNFGTGIMSYDGIYGSEDAYYEMDEQSLEYFIDDIIYDLKYKKKYSNKKHKIKLNRYSRKKITQQKYEKLDYITRNYHYTIDYDEDKQRYIRMYFSRHRKFAHKQTERKVRKSNDFKLKGGGYRKVYNYWDTVC